jgi:hypothetical protein
MVATQGEAEASRMVVTQVEPTEAKTTRAVRAEGLTGIKMKKAQDGQTNKTAPVTKRAKAHHAHKILREAQVVALATAVAVKAAATTVAGKAHARIARTQVRAKATQKKHGQVSNK